MKVRVMKLHEGKRESVMVNARHVQIDVPGDEDYVLEAMASDSDTGIRIALSNGNFQTVRAIRARSQDQRFIKPHRVKGSSPHIRIGHVRSIVRKLPPRTDAQRRHMSEVMKASYARRRAEATRKKKPTTLLPSREVTA